MPEEKEPKKKQRHFRVGNIEVMPGLLRPVHMWIDAGKPRWVNFRIHHSRRRFSMPLKEFIELGLRRAQVRYAEHHLSTPLRTGIGGQ